MALLDDIGSLLTTAGLVGGATGWTLAKASIPPTPDKVVALFQFGGRFPLARSLDRPTLQVIVRGEPRTTSGASAAVEAKIQAIYEALDAAATWPQTISGTSYRYAHPQQAPGQLRHDANDRPEWVVNFEIGVSR